MIEIKSLRCGNLVQYQFLFETEVHEITDISTRDNTVSFGHEYDIPIDDIQAIRLNESWLERLSIPTGMFNGNEYFSVARLNSDSETWGLYYEDGYTAVNFKYLHQLQNLYASICEGEELTINDKKL